MSGSRLCGAGLRTKCHLTESYDWDAERDNRYGRRYAQMGDLAKATSGFFLAIGMGVRRNLQEEREREQRERERHGLGESAEDGMYCEQHFRASPKDRLLGKAPLAAMHEEDHSRFSGIAQ